MYVCPKAWSEFGARDSSCFVRNGDETVDVFAFRVLPTPRTSIAVVEF